MKRILILVISLLMVMSWFLAACVPKAAPAPQAPAPAAAPVSAPAQQPARAAPAAPAKPAWQEEWEKTLDAAKKEGKLMLTTSLGAVARDAVAKALKSRFGIGTEWLAGASGELSARIMGERRAGIYSVDATIMGYSAPYKVLKPAGALATLEKLLFLPDLTDPNEIPKVWRFGHEWVDKDHTVLSFASGVQVGVMVNTQLVKPGEIKSYRDLLDAKWKEKIVLHDPTVGAGPGPTVIQALGDYYLGWDFVRKLAEQKPVLQRDARLQMTWLATGKYPIALGTRPEATKEFLDLGAPVKILLMEEGEATTPGASALSVIKEAPHPNAAKFFVNWLLSKEGQTVYCNASGISSNRMDVSVEGLYPEMIPDPKKKYVRTGTEEWILAMPEADKKMREIFAPR